MKKILLFAILLVAAMPIASFAEIKSLDGYGDLKWGDGINELKDAICEKSGKTIQCISKNDKDANHVTTYNFTDGKLESFNIQPRGKKSFSEVLTHLEDTFGTNWKEIKNVKVTAYEEGTETKKILKWKLEGAIVLLMGNDGSKIEPVVIVLRK